MSLQVTDIFHRNVAAINSGAKVIINKGGKGSSKTFSLLQLLINHAFQLEDKTITILGESIPHLDRGVIRETKKILRAQKWFGKIPYNEQKRVFTFPNNVILEFFSADRIDVGIGNRRYILYGNEINLFKQEIWDEMAGRSLLVFADFNPTFKFWLEDWLALYPNIEHAIIKSNYLDNPFLPVEERQKIEARAAVDENFKRVHVLCEYGNTDDLVFKPENIILIDEFPSDLKFTFGLDFGFIAPTALVKTALHGDDVFIDEQFYLPRLNTQQIIELCRTHAKGIRINADSEDSRMIHELDAAGINIAAAVKKSVREGISFLQSKRIYITKRSVNTIREFRSLTNEKNRAGEFTGNYIGDDHAVDSSRYSLETQRKQTSGFGSGIAGIAQDTPFNVRYGNQ